MTLADALAIAVPCVTIALAVFATYAGPLGAFLSARTHDTKWNGICAAAGRLAAEISTTLSTLPANAPLSVIKAQLISAGVTELKIKYAGSVALTGANDQDLTTVVSREIDKIPPKVSAALLGDATQVMTALNTAEPADPAAPAAPAPATPAAPPTPAPVGPATMPAAPPIPVALVGVQS